MSIPFPTNEKPTQENLKKYGDALRKKNLKATMEKEDYDKEEWGCWKIVSDMLDNPDENGIYPTSKCYQKLYDFVREQKQKVAKEVFEMCEGEKIYDPWAYGFNIDRTDGYNTKRNEITKLKEEYFK